MTHEDAGNYSAKHSRGTMPRQDIAAMAQKHIRDGKIACTAAHDIACKVSAAPSDVGATLDLMEVRIHVCQLGLFGYFPQKRIVRPAGHVTPDMKQVLEASVQDGRISCAEAWKAARLLKTRKIEVASACEGLGIKICACQLGAFG